MYIRRALALIVALAMITTLAACGGGNSTSTTGAAVTGTTASQGTDTATATTAATTPTKTPTQTTKQNTAKPRPAPTQKVPKTPAKGKEPIIEAPGARAACIRNANNDFSNSPALNAIIAQCNTLPR
jgi:hypothetical protein